MNLFLKAKHWQLFLLMVAIPVMLQMYLMISVFEKIEVAPNTNPEVISNLLNIIQLTIILYVGVFFGWFWSIAIGLQKKIPSEIVMKVEKFKIFFFFPLCYMLILLFYIIEMPVGINNTEFGTWIVAIIVPVHLFAMFCMFYMLYFVAKTIKTAELGRVTKFEDFVVEFFLLWFYIIGIWIIQPRVNKLIRT